MRILWSSDHHTLHQRTPTGHILNNLTKFLLKDHDPAQTDLYVFGGDFMERMVESPNSDMFKIAEWGKEFQQSVYEINPKAILIWLEGTSSHDWEQPRHFLNWAPKGLDVRWINKLCIQTFEQLDGLTIMFVPDNMGKMTPDEIWELALKVLKENNMTKVDMICFHGGFEFQLHAAARHKGHQLERWESIVRYYILAGHIHTPVSRGKLRTSGSFDRTAHGEEHPKGGLVIDLDLKAKQCTVNFWENKNALPYLTIKVDKDITAEDLIAKVHEFIRRRKLPPHSQLRIDGGSAHIVKPVLSMLENDYPLFGWKDENKISNDVFIDETLFDTKAYEGFTINKDNIKSALYTEVETKFNKLEISKEEAESILEEFL